MELRFTTVRKGKLHFEKHALKILKVFTLQLIHCYGNSRRVTTALTSFKINGV